MSCDQRSSVNHGVILILRIILLAGWVVPVVDGVADSCFMDKCLRPDFDKVHFKIGEIGWPQAVLDLSANKKDDTDAYGPELYKNCFHNYKLGEEDEKKYTATLGAACCTAFKELGYCYTHHCLFADAPAGTFYNANQRYEDPTLGINVFMQNKHPDTSQPLWLPVEKTDAMGLKTYEFDYFRTENGCGFNVGELDPVLTLETYWEVEEDPNVPWPDADRRSFFDYLHNHFWNPLNNKFQLDGDFLTIFPSAYDLKHYIKGERWETNMTDIPVAEGKPRKWQFRVVFDMSAGGMAMNDKAWDIAREMKTRFETMDKPEEWPQGWTNEPNTPIELIFHENGGKNENNVRYIKQASLVGTPAITRTLLPIAQGWDTETHKGENYFKGCTRHHCMQGDPWYHGWWPLTYDPGEGNGNLVGLDAFIECFYTPTTPIKPVSGMNIDQEPKRRGCCGGSPPMNNKEGNMRMIMSCHYETCATTYNPDFILQQFGRDTEESWHYLTRVHSRLYKQEKDLEGNHFKQIEEFCRWDYSELTTHNKLKLEFELFFQCPPDENDKRDCNAQGNEANNYNWQGVFNERDPQFLNSISRGLRKGLIEFAKAELSGPQRRMAERSLEKQSSQTNFASRGGDASEGRTLMHLSSVAELNRREAEHKKLSKKTLAKKRLLGERSAALKSASGQARSGKAASRRQGERGLQDDGGGDGETDGGESDFWTNAINNEMTIGIADVMKSTYDTDANGYGQDLKIQLTVELNFRFWDDAHQIYGFQKSVQDENGAQESHTYQNYIYDYLEPQFTGANFETSMSKEMRDMFSAVPANTEKNLLFYSILSPAPAWPTLENLWREVSYLDKGDKCIADHCGQYFQPQTVNMAGVPLADDVVQIGMRYDTMHSRTTKFDMPRALFNNGYRINSWDAMELRKWDPNYNPEMGDSIYTNLIDGYVNWNQPVTERMTYHRFDRQECIKYGYKPMKIHERCCGMLRPIVRCITQHCSDVYEWPRRGFNQDHLDGSFYYMDGFAKWDGEVRPMIEEKCGIDTGYSDVNTQVWLGGQERYDWVTSMGPGPGGLTGEFFRADFVYMYKTQLDKLGIPYHDIYVGNITVEWIFDQAISKNNVKMWVEYFFGPYNAEPGTAHYDNDHHHESVAKRKLSEGHGDIHSHDSSRRLSLGGGPSEQSELEQVRQMVLEARPNWESSGIGLETIPELDREFFPGVHPSSSWKFDISSSENVTFMKALRVGEEHPHELLPNTLEYKCIWNATSEFGAFGAYSTGGVPDGYDPFGYISTMNASSWYPDTLKSPIAVWNWCFYDDPRRTMFRTECCPAAIPTGYCAHHFWGHYGPQNRTAMKEMFPEEKLIEQTCGLNFETMEVATEFQGDIELYMDYMIYKYTDPGTVPGFLDTMRDALHNVFKNDVPELSSLYGKDEQGNDKQPPLNVSTTKKWHDSDMWEYTVLNFTLGPVKGANTSISNFISRYSGTYKGSESVTWREKILTYWQDNYPEGMSDQDVQNVYAHEPMNSDWYMEVGLYWNKTHFMSPKPITSSAQCYWQNCSDTYLDSSLWRMSNRTWDQWGGKYNVYHQCGQFYTSGDGHGNDKILLEGRKECCDTMASILSCLATHCPNYVDDDDEYKLFATSKSGYSKWNAALQKDEEHQYPAFNLSNPRHISGYEDLCRRNLMSGEKTSYHWIRAIQLLQIDQRGWMQGAFGRPQKVWSNSQVVYPFGREIKHPPPEIADPSGSGSQIENPDKTRANVHDVLYRYHMQNLLEDKFRSYGEDFIIGGTTGQEGVQLYVTGDLMDYNWEMNYTWGVIPDWYIPPGASRRSLEDGHTVHSRSGDSRSGDSRSRDSRPKLKEEGVDNERSVKERERTGNDARSRSLQEGKEGEENGEGTENNPPQKWWQNNDLFVNMSEPHYFTLGIPFEIGPFEDYNMAESWMNNYRQHIRNDRKNFTTHGLFLNYAVDHNEDADNDPNTNPPDEVVESYNFTNFFLQIKNSGMVDLRVDTEDGPEGFSCGVGECLKPNPWTQAGQSSHYKELYRYRECFSGSDSKYVLGSQGFQGSGNLPNNNLQFASSCCSPNGDNFHLGNLAHCMNHRCNQENKGHPDHRRKLVETHFQQLKNFRALQAKQKTERNLRHRSFEKKLQPPSSASTVKDPLLAARLIEGKMAIFSGRKLLTPHHSQESAGSHEVTMRKLRSAMPSALIGQSAIEATCDDSTTYDVNPFSAIDGKAKIIAAWWKIDLETDFLKDKDLKGKNTERWILDELIGENDQTPFYKLIRSSIAQVLSMGIVDYMNATMYPDEYGSRLEYPDVMLRLRPEKYTVSTGKQQHDQHAINIHFNDNKYFYGYISDVNHTDITDMLQWTLNNRLTYGFHQMQHLQDEYAVDVKDLFGINNNNEQEGENNDHGDTTEGGENNEGGDSTEGGGDGSGDGGENNKGGDVAYRHLSKGRRTSNGITNARRLTSGGDTTNEGGDNNEAGHHHGGHHDDRRPKIVNLAWNVNYNDPEKNARQYDWEYNMGPWDRCQEKHCSKMEIWTANRAPAFTQDACPMDNLTSCCHMYDPIINCFAEHCSNTTIYPEFSYYADLFGRDCPGNFTHFPLRTAYQLYFQFVYKFTATDQVLRKLKPGAGKFDQLLVQKKDDFIKNDGRKLYDRNTKDTSIQKRDRHLSDRHLSNKDEDIYQYDVYPWFSVWQDHATQMVSNDAWSWQHSFTQAWSYRREWLIHNFYEVINVTLQNFRGGYETPGLYEAQERAKIVDYKSYEEGYANLGASDFHIVDIQIMDLPYNYDTSAPGENVILTFNMTLGSFQTAAEADAFKTNHLLVEYPDFDTKGFGKDFSSLPGVWESNEFASGDGSYPFMQIKPETKMEVHWFPHRVDRQAQFKTTTTTTTTASTTSTTTTTTPPSPPSRPLVKDYAQEHCYYRFHVQTGEVYATAWNQMRVQHLNDAVAALQASSAPTSAPPPRKVSSSDSVASTAGKVSVVELKPRSLVGDFPNVNKFPPMNETEFQGFFGGLDIDICINYFEENQVGHRGYNEYALYETNVTYNNPVLPNLIPPPLHLPRRLDSKSKVGRELMSDRFLAIFRTSKMNVSTYEKAKFGHSKARITVPMRKPERQDRKGRSAAQPRVLTSNKRPLRALAGSSNPLDRCCRAFRQIYGCAHYELNFKTHAKVSETTLQKCGMRIPVAGAADFHKKVTHETFLEGTVFTSINEAHTDWTHEQKQEFTDVLHNLIRTSALAAFAGNITVDRKEFKTDLNVTWDLTEAVSNWYDPQEYSNDSSPPEQGPVLPAVDNSGYNYRKLRKTTAMIEKRGHQSGGQQTGAQQLSGRIFGQRWKDINAVMKNAAKAKAEEWSEKVTADSAAKIGKLEVNAVRKTQSYSDWQGTGTAYTRPPLPTTPPPSEVDFEALWANWKMSDKKEKTLKFKFRWGPFLTDASRGWFHAPPLGHWGDMGSQIVVNSVGTKVTGMRIKPFYVRNVNIPDQKWNADNSRKLDHAEPENSGTGIIPSAAAPVWQGLSEREYHIITNYVVKGCFLQPQDGSIVYPQIDDSCLVPGAIRPTIPLGGSCVTGCAVHQNYPGQRWVDDPDVEREPGYHCDENSRHFSPPVSQGCIEKSSCPPLPLHPGESPGDKLVRVDKTGILNATVLNNAELVSNPALVSELAVTEQTSAEFGCAAGYRAKVPKAPGESETVEKLRCDQRFMQWVVDKPEGSAEGPTMVVTLPGHVPDVNQITRIIQNEARLKPGRGSGPTHGRSSNKLRRTAAGKKISWRLRKIQRQLARKLQVPTFENVPVMPSIPFSGSTLSGLSEGKSSGRASGTGSESATTTLTSTTTASLVSFVTLNDIGDQYCRLPYSCGIESVPGSEWHTPCDLNTQISGAGNHTCTFHCAEGSVLSVDGFQNVEIPCRDGRFIPPRIYDMLSETQRADMTNKEVRVGCVLAAGASETISAISASLSVAVTADFVAMLFNAPPPIEETLSFAAPQTATQFGSSANTIQDGEFVDSMEAMPDGSGMPTGGAGVMVQTTSSTSTTTEAPIEFAPGADIKPQFREAVQRQAAVFMSLIKTMLDSELGPEDTVVITKLEVLDAPAVPSALSSTPSAWPMSNVWNSNVFVRKLYVDKKETIKPKRSPGMQEKSGLSTSSSKCFADDETTSCEVLRHLSVAGQLNIEFDIRVRGDDAATRADTLATDLAARNALPPTHENSLETAFQNSLASTFNVAAEQVDAMIVGVESPKLDVQKNLVVTKNHYLPEKWGTCSKTCGSGTQTRGLYCPTAESGDQCSTDPKTFPMTEQPCTETAGCMKGNPWTRCTNTCGTGTQTRTLFCPAEDKSFCDPDESTFPAIKQECAAYEGCSFMDCPMKNEDSMTCEEQRAMLNYIILGVVALVILCIVIYIYRGCRRPKHGKVSLDAMDGKKGISIGGKKKDGVKWHTVRDEKTGKRKVVWELEDALKEKFGIVVDIEKGADISPSESTRADSKETPEKDKDEAAPKDKDDGASKDDDHDDYNPLRALASKPKLKSRSANSSKEKSTVASTVDTKATAEDDKLSKVDEDSKSIVSVSTRVSSVAVPLLKPPACFETNSRVEYYSTTFRAWIPSVMMGHMPQTNTCTISVHAKQIRPGICFEQLRTPLRAGERCQVWIDKVKKDNTSWVGPCIVEQLLDGFRGYLVRPERAKRVDETQAFAAIAEGTAADGALALEDGRDNIGRENTGRENSSSSTSVLGYTDTESGIPIEDAASGTDADNKSKSSESRKRRMRRPEIFRVEASKIRRLFRRGDLVVVLYQQQWKKAKVVSMKKTELSQCHKDEKEEKEDRVGMRSRQSFMQRATFMPHARASKERLGSSASIEVVVNAVGTPRVPGDAQNAGTGAGSAPGALPRVNTVPVSKPGNAFGSVVAQAALANPEKRHNSVLNEKMHKMVILDGLMVEENDPAEVEVDVADDLFGAELTVIFFTDDENASGSGSASGAASGTVESNSSASGSGVSESGSGNVDEESVVVLPPGTMVIPAAVADSPLCVRPIATELGTPRVEAPRRFSNPSVAAGGGLPEALPAGVRINNALKGVKPSTTIATTVHVEPPITPRVPPSPVKTKGGQNPDSYEEDKSYAEDKVPVKVEKLTVEDLADMDLDSHMESEVGKQ